MKTNRTFIVLVLLLFMLGMMVGNVVSINIPDFDNQDQEVSGSDDYEKPGYDYQKRIVVEGTSNLFVRVALMAQSIMTRLINIGVGLLQSIFSIIFGT